MGLEKLNQKLQDPDLQESFKGIFPRDHPKNIRFSINFFTSIGLGALTEELRKYLNSLSLAIEPTEQQSESDGSTSSSGSESSSDTSSESDSSSSSEEETKHKSKKNVKKDSKKR